jgi:hypothetical protein
MSLIPTWPFVAGALVVGLIGGFAAERTIKNGDIATIKLNYGTALKMSADALGKANKDATDHEKADTKTFADLATKYEETRQNEKARDSIVIADLRSDVKRLRVSTNRPASGGHLPGAPASASGSNDQADETLAPAVAARLAERYADYNEIVGQLWLCQDTLRAERKNLATTP